MIPRFQIKRLVSKETAALACNFVIDLKGTVTRMTTGKKRNISVDGNLKIMAVIINVLRLDKVVNLKFSNSVADRRNVAKTEIF